MLISAKVNTGLRQRYIPSPILFNLILDKVIKETNINDEIVLRNSNINLLANADDLAILRDTEDEVKQMYRNLLTTGYQWYHSGKMWTAGMNGDKSKTRESSVILLT